MSFVKRKTLNPAGGVNPALEPNVGQFGWTKADSAHVNQLISYVKAAQEAAQNAADNAEYIKTRLVEIDKAILYFEDLFEQIKPIADNIVAMYEHIKEIRDKINVQEEDIRQMDTQIRAIFIEIGEILEEMKALRSETLVYKDSAKVSETKSKEYLDASISIYEELKKGQVYRGTWNPNTGAYPDPKDTNSVWDVVLNAGQEDTGHIFDNKKWYFGDRLIYVKEDNKFDQLASGTSVKSVNGKTGAVLLNAADVGALDKAGDTLTGTLSQNIGGYGARLTGAGGIGYLQAGKFGGDDSDQKMHLTGQAATNLTELKIKLAQGVNPQVVWPGGTYNVYHSGDKPTAGDINAVSKEGDEMRGRLIAPTLKVTANSEGLVNATDKNLIRQGGDGTATVIGNTYGIPYIDAKDGVAYVRDQNGANGTVYHSLKKPTAGDVGALPSTGGTVAGTLNVNGDFKVHHYHGGYVHKNLGTISDRMAGIVLIAPTAKSGDRKSVQGFVGRIYVNRGSSGEFNLIHYVDVIVKAAYDSTITQIVDQNIPAVGDKLAKIVITTYQGAEWVGVYFPAWSSRTVVINGYVMGNNPFLIGDATDYNIIDRDTMQEVARAGVAVRSLEVKGTGATDGYRYNGRVAIGGEAGEVLRLNPFGHFTNGIHTGTAGNLRHDGSSVDFKDWTVHRDFPVRITKGTDETYVVGSPGVASVNVKHANSNNALRVFNSYDENNTVRSSISVRSDSIGSIHFTTNSDMKDHNRVAIHSGQVFAYGNQSTDANALIKKGHADSTFVKKSGDTMTGKLFLNDGVVSKASVRYLHEGLGRGITLSANTSGYSEVVPSVDGVEQWGQGLRHYGGLDWRVYNHAIYHEGKKPTSTEVGAMSSTPTKVTTSVDLNSYTTNGTYNLYKGNNVTLTNAPTGFDYGTLLVVGSGSEANTFVTQTLTQRGGASKTWTRTRNDGTMTWYDWAEVFTSKNPPTVDQLDAVKKSGDNMSGPLGVTRINHVNLPSANQQLVNADSTGRVFVGNPSTVNDLRLQTNNGTAYVTSGDTTFRIYHQGYKPSASDVGAPTLNSTTRAIEVQSPDSGITGGMIRTRSDGANQVTWVSATRATDSKSIGAHSSRGPVYHDGGATRDIYHTGRKPTFTEILEGDTSVEMTKTYRFEKPAGAVDGKYYPVLVGTSNDNEDLYINTRSSSSGDPMNNCSFSGKVRSGGWSDRGTYADGMFRNYSTDERAIHSIVGGSESDNCYAIYVEARAFPITVKVPHKTSVTVHATDAGWGTSVFKAGISLGSAPPNNDYGTKISPIVNFNKGSGHYTPTIYSGNVQANGWIKSTSYINSNSTIMAGNTAWKAMMRTSGTSGEYLFGGNPDGVDADHVVDYIRVGRNNLKYTTNNQEYTIYHSGNKPTAADLGVVSSVNGKKGDVTLTASDFGGIPSTGGTATGTIVAPRFQATSDYAFTRQANDNHGMFVSTASDARTIIGGGSDQGSIEIRPHGIRVTDNRTVFNKNGNIESGKAPTENNHLVNKAYADTKLSASGGTLKGILSVEGKIEQTEGGFGTRMVGANERGYFQAGSGDNSKPHKMTLSGWANNPLTEVEVYMTGGTVKFLGSGHVQASQAPTDGTHLSNKAYVDTKVALGGSTMTGTLTVPTIIDHNTNIGKTSTDYTALTNWAKPVGSSVFATPTSTGVPGGQGGYWKTLGRRDTLGGYAGIWVDYNNNQPGVYIGKNENGTNNPVWAKVYTDKAKPSAAELGVLSLSGGTLTGALESTQYARFRGNIYSMYNNPDAGSICIGGNGAGYGEVVGKAKTHSEYQWNHGLRFYEDNTWRVGTNKIYHQGFKPTASELSVAGNYEIISTNGGGSRWVCIGRIGRTDSSATMIISGTGDFGGRSRDNITVSIAARTNVVFVDANRFKRRSTYGNDVKLFTKDTGSAFELWMEVTSYQSAVKYTLLSGTGWTDMRSGTTTTKPADLVEVDINDTYTTANKPTASDVGALSLTGGVVTGNTILRQSGTGIWPNADAASNNNYIRRAGLTVKANNSGVHFFGDEKENARRMGIQAGHGDAAYANHFGVLDLNPFGGDVRANGAKVITRSGGTLDGKLEFIGRPTATAISVKRSNASQNVHFGQSGDSNGEALIGVGVDSDDYKAYLKVGIKKLVYQDGTNGEKRLYHEGYNPHTVTVQDVRGGDRKPNYFAKSTLIGFFNETAMPTSGWHSGINVKGWDHNYHSWQLVSGADTGSNGNKLFFRTGKDDTWGNFYEVYHSGRKPSIEDIGAMGSRNGSITNQSWNTIDKPGSYSVDNFTGTDGPAVIGQPAVYTYGTLLVQNNGKTIQQMYIADNNRIYLRDKYSTNNWGYWSAVSSDEAVHIDTPINLDDFSNGGTYNLYKGGSVVFTNAPSDFSYGTLQVIGRGRTNSSFVTQILTWKDNGRQMIRTRNDGSMAWTSWRKIYSESQKPNASDVGAVNKTGDTMTGHLKIDGNTVLPKTSSFTNAPDGPLGLGIFETSENVTGYSNYSTILNVNSSGYNRQFQILGASDGNEFKMRSSHVSNTGVDPTTKWHPWRNLYHTGYKPTANDVLAVPVKKAHYQDWTSAADMAGKTYVGGYQSPDEVASYMAFGAKGGANMDIFLDGEMYVSQGRNKVYHAGNKPNANDVGAITREAYLGEGFRNLGPMQSQVGSEYKYRWYKLCEHTTSFSVDTTFDVIISADKNYAGSVGRYFINVSRYDGSGDAQGVLHASITRKYGSPDMISVCVKKETGKTTIWVASKRMWGNIGVQVINRGTDGQKPTWVADGTFILADDPILTGVPRLNCGNIWDGDAGAVSYNFNEYFNKVHDSGSRVFSAANKPRLDDLTAGGTLGGSFKNTSWIESGGTIKSIYNDAKAFVAERNGYKAMMGVSATNGEYIFGGSASSASDYQHYIRLGNNKFQYHQAGSNYNVYHEGNKPTADAIGAVPASKVLDGSGSVTWNNLINKIPYINNVGVTELGRYVDMREGEADADFDWRWDAGAKGQNSLQLLNRAGSSVAEFDTSGNIRTPVGALYCGGGIDAGSIITTHGNTIQMLSDDSAQHIWFKSSSGAEKALIWNDNNQGLLQFRANQTANWVAVDGHGSVRAHQTGDIGVFRAMNKVIGSAAGVITGDIQPGSWVDWRNRASMVQADVSQVDAGACNIWKATKWSSWHVAAMDVHVPGNINEAQVSMHLGQSNNQFAFKANGQGFASAGWHTGSDARFKKDIKPLDQSELKIGESWLDKVCSLQASSFEYKSNEGKTSIGFIAQDVQEVIPEAITVQVDTTVPEEEREGTDRLFIDPMAIIAAQNEAIKELRDMIASLKEEVVNLKSAKTAK